MAAVSHRRALRTPPRATRNKAAVSYAESSGDEVEENEEESGSEAENSRPIPRARNAPRVQTQQKRPRPLSSQGAVKEGRRHKRRQIGTTLPRANKPKASTRVIPIQYAGVIPKWQTLPYHIWVQVFEYAAHPLYEEHTFQPTPSGRWLLNVARLCHAFAEPAFTVLYATPPLVPMVLAHRLVDLLMADPIPMAYKYRQKVETLRIDVGQVAAYSLPGSGLLDLHGLIKDLPRLTDLEFYHQKDMSPYRDLDANIKWTYPASIFEALEFVNPSTDPNRGDKTSVCKLRSWRWSSRLGGKTWPIEKVQEVHLRPCFTSLQKVAFVNYQVPSLRKDEEDPNHEKVLAEALKVLPNLKHLIFESSTLVNAKLLPMLPTGLRNLELINCWEVIADDFAAFLLTHGRQLRCVTLNHNQSLSLSFLPMLGVGCPNLQVFRMNLTYFNLHATYRDSEPQYKQLLLPDEIPSWPATLQTIELIQMRKWETQTAEMFFQSLLDNAGTLPDLRRLTIQAILNIGWRDRASFRDKWIGSLNRVFKRATRSPKPVTTLAKALLTLSPQAPREKKEPTEEGSAAAEVKRSSLRQRSTQDDPIPATVSVVIPAQPNPKKTQISSKADDSPPARRSTRSIAQNLPSGKYAESSDESEADSDEVPSLSYRPGPRRTGLERELGILQATAGMHSQALMASLSASSDDEPLMAKSGNKGKGKMMEVIQGMCDAVEIRIDNLRPTETQVTEADFLDEERSGDDDWNGEDGEDEGYAW